MRERLLGLAGAARQPIERLGVEAFLAEAGKQRAQAGAREARVGVGRVVDERRAARVGEGDEIALLQAHERPGDRHAVARGLQRPCRAAPRRRSPRNRRKSTVSA